ncbi:MAG: amidohydrolase family protein [bacterium]|nr:amidohydrolase family protein [bacterium]
MTESAHIPHLADNHNHLSFYASLFHCPHLRRIEDKPRALAILQGCDKEKVTLVLGWNNGYYAFSPEELAAFPPVIIVNISLHSMLISPSAESILKHTNPLIIENYTNPVWYEDHLPQILVFLANRADPDGETIDAFFRFLEEKGIHYIEDMLLTGESILWKILDSSYAHRAGFWADMDTFGTLSHAAREHIKGIKLFTDGALGSTTAALSEPFNNGGKGYLLFPDSELHCRLAEVASLGKTAAVHAIGDLACCQVVRVLKALDREGIGFNGLRMEHCQFIDKACAVEAKALGVILSMQPNFSTDSIFYRDRLGPAWCERNNPFRMLIDEVGFVPGKDLLFGSDGMPHGTEAAVECALNPPFPGQVLTLDELIAGCRIPA